MLKGYILHSVYTHSTGIIHYIMYVQIIRAFIMSKRSRQNFAMSFVVVIVVVFSSDLQAEKS